MCAAVVLSLDAADTTGEHAATSSLASNGEIHKIRLNLEGQRIGLGGVYWASAVWLHVVKAERGSLLIFMYCTCLLPDVSLFLFCTHTL